MGHQIILQPNKDSDGENLYCIFSTGVDNVVAYDAGYSEVIEYFVERAANDARQSVIYTMDELEAGRNPYPKPFGLDDYGEMLERIEAVHGPEERRKIEDLGKVDESQPAT